MSRLPASFAKHLKPVRQPAIRPTSTAATSGVDALLKRAKEHHDKGEVKQAESICASVLARDPGNARALLLAGSLAHGMEDLGLAIVFYKKAIDRHPDSAQTHIVLASAYEEAGEYENAIEHFNRGLELQPDSVAALEALARTYTAAGRAELALPLFETATILKPEHKGLRLLHANALIALGRMDEAAQLLNQSIARGFSVAGCYRALADTRKFVGEPTELRAIAERLEATGVSNSERVLLQHAAGKILNDLGRYEEAIDNYQAAKTGTGYGFDIEAYRRLVDTLIAAFTPQLMKSKAGFGDPTEVPVFIVGMPRSGTTLTEQICASHPAVHGAGELYKLGTVVRTGGFSPSPSGSIRKPPQALTVAEARSLAADYLNFVQRMSPSSARIVDKMPHNFELVGMITLLFPNARIIHCKRDPIDNCISCLFNTFSEKHGYNTDLHTLGLYYREYNRLMQHWNSLLPGRIYESNYEAMTDDQEAETRRLIDFLGLPWDDACLRFYETDRSVITPSRWQVRQPIYRSSVKRWKKYEHKIQPLIEALGDLADS